jgi:hypothetical protein
MTFGRVLPSILCAALFAGFASAKIIDGVMDDLYTYGNPITPNSFGNGFSYPVDFHDNFVRFYVLYDDENLYGF